GSGIGQTSVKGSNNGIYSRSTGGSNITVTLNSNVTGTGGNGIFLQTNGGGGVTVNNNQGAFTDTVTGHFSGIVALAGSGPITVNQKGDVTGTLNGGIYAI